eukprot:6178159-Pleurochrysis_carterae.AAC.2
MPSPSMLRLQQCPGTPSPRRLSQCRPPRLLLRFAPPFAVPRTSLPTQWPCPLRGWRSLLPLLPFPAARTLLLCNCPAGAPFSALTSS